VQSPLESEIQSSILDYLRAKRILCWKAGTGAFKVGDRFVRMGQPGVSDIIGCLPSGTFLAIEVKRAGNPPTSEQARFIADVIRNGGVVLVARSIDERHEAGNLARLNRCLLDLRRR
jgi:VRR-NUC domain